MAQKHKAATEVTIATPDDSALHDFVQRYWKLGALFGLVIAAIVIGKEMSASSGEAARARSWDRLREEVDFGTGIFASIQLPAASRLSAVADDVKDGPAGPWARALEVQKLVADGEYFAANDAWQRLEEDFPNHALVTGAYRFAEGESTELLKDHLVSRMQGVISWEEKHKSLFENAALPADAPKVRLNTSKGAIVVGLYTEQAPEHAANFLKLCQEGFYDNILFHRVSRNFMIQGGDPNSRDNADKETWGQGGPDYKLDPELSDLRHFKYVLAAAKNPMDTESSGSQFYITVGTPHHLDGVHTVFGAVVEGQAVVDEIAAGEIEAGTTDRPRDPVVIQSTEVL